MTKEELQDAKTKYRRHKNGAIKRGIPFNLSFDEWYYDIWQASGKWDQRGCRKGQYVMSRYNDTGPYEVGNVFIQSHADNNREAHKGKAKGPITIEHRKNLAKAKKGSLPWNKGKSHPAATLAHKGVPKPRSSCIHCKKEVATHIIAQYHGDKCPTLRNSINTLIGSSA